MKQKEQKSGRSRFRFIDFLIVVLCLSLMTYSIKVFRDDLYQTISLQNVQPVGTITIKNNIVQRRIADRVLWDRLRVESPVYLGDIIRVAEQSEATLNIEDQHLDIGENTLIRILLSPDGSGALQIELTEGSLALSSLALSSLALSSSGVTTGAEGGGLQLNMMGRVIETGAGTVLSAVAGKDGIALQVTEGKAVFIEDGVSREIASGSMIALNAEGAEQRVPAAVVTQPRANARYVKDSPAPLPVRFSWNRVNLSPQDTLRLEIASDRNFNRDVQSFDNLVSTAQASLGTGAWNWRLLYENTLLSSGRITVVEAASFSLSSPARGSLFNYSDELPSLRFQWSELEEASHYNIEIAPSPDFANPQINRQINAPFFVDSSLAEGTWYWRVQPVFSSSYEGGAAFTPASFFRIERTEQAASGEQTAVLLEGEQLRELEQSVRNETQSEAAALAEVRPEPPPEQPVRQTQPPRRTQTPSVQQTPSASVQPLLPPPGNRRPANGHVIGIEQLKTQRNIVFTWAAVEGANAYIFTLYEQGAEGRRQIAGVIITGPAWTLEDISVLERGTKVWQVEAISRNADGAIVRHGTLGENTFTMDIPVPRPVQMEAPGVLYGF